MSGTVETGPHGGEDRVGARGGETLGGGEVHDGARIWGRRRIEVDAVVVGAGAGGAPVAKELAEGGLRVAMIEEGPSHSADRFSARPAEMTPRLYRDAAQTVALGNVSIGLPIGWGVGGTSLVNSGTCFRAPAAVLQRWASDFGLDELAGGAMDPCFARVERELRVSRVTPELAGRNALVVKRGADVLGWSGDFIARNAHGCVGSGICNFGCPTSAKQHVGITYVPRAHAAGASTWTGARVTEVSMRAGRARGIRAETVGGGSLEVTAELVVLAAGAIYTPRLLAGQGLGGCSGELGGNLSIHPATAVRAIFDEQIDMARGVPQSYFVDEFADEGIMLEGAGGAPDITAGALASHPAEEIRELMLSYRHLSQFGAMVSDRSRGKVGLRGARPRISYRLAREDVATFKRSLEHLGELYAAAGAHTVIYPVEGLAPLPAGELGPIRRLRLRARDLGVFAFHPLGTARADRSPARGVVDQDLRVHGTEGLYVADGSVVPSSLGVNPQMTIMALATRLAYHLLGRPCPS